MKAHNSPEVLYICQGYCREYSNANHDEPGTPRMPGVERVILGRSIKTPANEISRDQVEVVMQSGSSGCISRYSTIAHNAIGFRSAQ
jgi:hypothetical protein